MPAEIQVQQEILKELFAPLRDELGMRLILQQHLPAIEEASRS